MFIFWIILIIGVIYFLKQQDQQSSMSSKHPQYLMDQSKDALDILRERYARGEISEQEYYERKKVLQNLY